jgi:quinol monooxygenase YgiN
LPVLGVWLLALGQRTEFHSKTETCSSLPKIRQAIGDSCADISSIMSSEKEKSVVIVAGHLIVDPEQRGDYLVGCKDVVEQARRAPGCLDFAVTADLLDSSRVNIFERWESQAAVDAFRGSGPSDGQLRAVISAVVVEYDVMGERSLT